MKNIIISVVMSFAIPALKQLGEVLWEAFWDFLYQAMVVAEGQWAESGKGADKKEFVLAQISTWLDSRTKLNGFQKKMVKWLVTFVIDALIKRLNEELDKSWGSKVKSLKAWIESRGIFAQLVLR